MFDFLLDYFEEKKNLIDIVVIFVRLLYTFIGKLHL